MSMNSNKYKLLGLLVFLAIVFCGCSSFFNKKYTIGVDPGFYPANTGSQADQVYGFTLDLFQAISKLEHIQLKVVPTGEESLSTGLKRGGFNAIVTASEPIAKEKNVFSVSETYLLLGPVIVVPTHSSISALNQLGGKVVAVMNQSDAFYMIQKYPRVIIETYENPALLMEGLQYNLADAALVDVLVAKELVNNPFSKDLKIVSEPLNKNGLRLLVVQNREPYLNEIFNRGLKRAKAKGIYKNLLKKWNLSV